MLWIDYLCGLLFRLEDFQADLRVFAGFIQDSCGFLLVSAGFCGFATLLHLLDRQAFLGFL